ncbi:YihY/virulence factor BrkB family protein [Sphingopyxis sp. BSNA05]|uniref:YihY/virulence factor BrkB family protein n=1 Tax=Sphingopyxis sp. BSNA05 TaxID=1236614 RepID=UPI0020B8CFA0|nr:YihY/virulence factor BrkB family protein [Sphingopyxis sp. BSNA05]
MPAENDSAKSKCRQRGGWRSFGLGICSNLARGEIWSHCASVGFFGFLSIFPLMAVFVLVYGLAFSAPEIEAHIAAFRPFLPTNVYSVLAARLKDLSAYPVSHMTAGLIITSLVSLYMGSRGTKYTIFLIKVVYHESANRSFFREIIVALIVTLGALLVLSIALAGLAIAPLLTQHFPFPDAIKTAIFWGRWPILACMIFVSIIILYNAASVNGARPFRAHAAGAALAAVLWLILSVGFSYYVSNFGRYSFIFGTLSAAVVLMLWIYYCSIIIALGAAVNYQLETESR